ncbi:TetR family transcriptional regulator [Nitrogeniibacter mangrovi]|uniref:TetR family transcriptional regulator n=2 Tax=Nitrogeniibacter mangrovi TaxID=2016596 RepID=A0A6C1BA36_9RHOO|nr:TetR family transcriptional regulator [Nitrogeniibacter mangrovi]
MTPEQSVPGCGSRADVRREQILAAAEACFRTHGFHGASMSKLCAQAGMSPGHVYHYFESKEAIIEGIVRRKADAILARVEATRNAPNVLDATLERAGEGIADKLDPDFAALELEIVSEACRNPRVARIVRDSDHEVLSNFTELVLGLRRDLGHEDSKETLDALVDMIAILFDGITVRGIRHPEMDRERVVALFEKTLRFLIVEWR